MSEDRWRNTAIRQFILEHVTDHPRDITTFTARHFGLSRPGVLRHVHRLVRDGVLRVSGTTRNRQYTLPLLINQQRIIPITPELQEDSLWRQTIQPFLSNAAPNVLDICQYGFTEMVNNVIEHSEGRMMTVVLQCTAVGIHLEVIDDGIGIFRKIQTCLGLDDPRHAILELAKGKLTTDPHHHTGEGIFFTSRVFDVFSILSENLCFLHMQHGDDWLWDLNHTQHPGTRVIMDIASHATCTLQSVFEQYAAAQDDYGFTRTRVPVILAKYGDEHLVSRSQARRLLARVERFKEVVLDFKSITQIGQAFADEVFRIFPHQHPHVHLVWLNANDQITRMIQRAQSTFSPAAPFPPV
jgi:anti-sigma regulatory factor (Ser/Thr protein kinase)/uncharacterized protein (DUF1330 family)